MKVFLIALLFLSLNLYANAPNSEDAATNSIVSLLVGTDNEEHIKSRKIFTFNANNEEIVISTFVFTPTGGNNVQYYMAAFKKECNLEFENGNIVCKGLPVFKFVAWELIGERSDISKKNRQVDTSSLAYKDGIFSFIVHEYTPDDAMCCPSKKRELKFKLQETHFVEVI